MTMSTSSSGIRPNRHVSFQESSQASPVRPAAVPATTYRLVGFVLDVTATPTAIPPRATAVQALSVSATAFGVHAAGVQVLCLGLDTITSLRLVLPPAVRDADQFVAVVTHRVPDVAAGQPPGGTIATRLSFASHSDMFDACNALDAAVGRLRPHEYTSVFSVG